MITRLEGDAFEQAMSTIAGMIDAECRLSIDWLSKTQNIALPREEGLPVFECEERQRFISALSTHQGSSIIATPTAPLIGESISLSGSTLLGKNTVRVDKPVIYSLSNDSESLTQLFDDVLFSSALISDMNGSFAIMEHIPAEHSVLSGSQTFIECCIGMPLKNGWNEFDEVVTSWKSSSSDFRYLQSIFKYYRSNAMPIDC